MAKVDITSILEELRDEMSMSFEKAIAKSQGEGEEMIDEEEELPELPELEDEEMMEDEEELPELEDEEMLEEELPIIKKKYKK